MEILTLNVWFLGTWSLGRGVEGKQHALRIEFRSTTKLQLVFSWPCCKFHHQIIVERPWYNLNACLLCQWRVHYPQTSLVCFCVICNLISEDIIAWLTFGWHRYDIARLTSVTDWMVCNSIKYQWIVVSSFRRTLMEMAGCLKAVLLVLHLLFLIVSSEEWYSLNVRSHASTPYEGMSEVMRIQYGLGLMYLCNNRIFSVVSCVCKRETATRSVECCS